MAIHNQKTADNISVQRYNFKVKLLSQFLLIGLLSSLFQFIVNVFGGVKGGGYSEVIFGVILLILYILTRKGHFRAARIGSLIIINLTIFLVSNLDPLIGVQYYYFPMLLLSLVLHTPKEWVKNLLFSLLPIFLFVLNTIEHFEVTTYLVERNIVSIIVNFVTASIVSSIAIIYLIKSNINSENLLIKANDFTSKVSEELRLNNKTLAKTNNELDKFIYSASHDLRAPLASILGLVNLAKLEPLEKQVDYIEKIRARVNALDLFIKDIIHFSKNSNTDIKYETIDLQKLINKSLKRTKYLPHAAKIKVLLHIATPKIESDTFRLSSILTTLISNAIKYHNMEQEQPMIWVDVRNSNPVEFTIRDNGNGINKQIMPHIFDMFYRGDERSNGPGLGLYIAKEMLNSLHGRINVSSEEGQGATFTFYLPISNKQANY